MKKVVTTIIITVSIICLLGIKIKYVDEWCIVCAKQQHRKLIIFRPFNFKYVVFKKSNFSLLHKFLNQLISSCKTHKWKSYHGNQKSLSGSISWSSRVRPPVLSCFEDDLEFILKKNPELLKEILIEIMELSRKLFFKKNTLAGQKKRKEFIEKISDFLHNCKKVKN